MRLFLMLTSLALLPLSSEAAEVPPIGDVITADHPVVWWRFEEEGMEVPRTDTSAALPEFGGTKHGKVTLGGEGPRPPYFPGHAEQNHAVQFHGDGGSLRYADPGDNSPLDFTNGDAMTLEAWVNVTKLGDGQQMYVIGKGRTKNPGVASENQNYALRLSGIKGQAGLSFLFRDADNRAGKQEDYHRWNSSTGFGVDSGWHHIAVTYLFGEPDSLRGYIDGERVEGKWEDYGGATKEPPVVDNDELWIGSSMGGSASSTLQGWLDEVALYRTALAPERIKLRAFRVQPPSYQTPAEEVRADSVYVELFHGIPDKLAWDFPTPKPVEAFRWSGFAMTELPQWYTARGVRGDRTNPLMVRLSGVVTWPAGPITVRTRSRSGARLFVDEQLVSETAFSKRGGDGHGEMYPFPETAPQALRGLPTGDQEQVATFVATGRPQRVQYDVFVGGRKRRPEVGELVIAWTAGDDTAAKQSPGQVLLSDERLVPFTNAAWEAFAPSLSLDERNQVNRREASREWRAYWDRRHTAAKVVLSGWPALEVPAGTGTPIDRFLQQLWSKAGVTPPAVIDDLAFARRVSLDLIGTIPTLAQLDEFLRDPAETRRAQLVNRLLEQPGWADHWVGYWQDVLAENPNLINPTLNNTGPFRWWLHESFSDRKPFDQFATELMLMDGSTHYGGPAGFSLASQNDAPMAAKAHILAQAFLGMEMKCARCHDAPYHQFTQKDLFSLAAMLQRDTLKLPKSSTIPGDPAALQSLLVKVSLRPGDTIDPQWPFAEELAGQLEDDLLVNPKDRREQLAALVTAPTNHRFAQVIVNRVWQRLFGRGLVEPADDWEHPSPADPVLLEWLEREFIASGYDLRAIQRAICLSTAYQLPADAAAASDIRRAALFVGPSPRRMMAEQIVDSLFVASGKPWNVEVLNIDVDGTRDHQSSLNFGVPTRAWQFLSLSNERDRPSLTLPTAQPVIDVLEAFGWRGARPDPLTVRPQETTVLQPAILANGVLVKRMTQLSDDSRFTELALTAKSPEALLDSYTRAILTRGPTSAERETLLPLLQEGFADRLVKEIPSVTPALGKPSPRLTGVAWSNHLKPEASDRKLAAKEQVDQGDPPTARLQSAWRERAEDTLWTLFNTADYLFVP